MIQAQSALEWLDGTQRFGIKLGLENIHRLLKMLDRPDEHLCCIHVAGTNGKGSVCAMMESIFRTGGFKTGLYTSPHLVDLRERFRVGGKLIPAADLDRILSRIRRLVAEWEHCPTFFEITTAAALVYFFEQQVDVVLLETGMGGRLDATNAVQPKVSVITRIGRDHQQWLGNSLEQIAAEKAGIIKPGVPVITTQQDAAAAAVLSDTAERMQSSLLIADSIKEGVSVGLCGIHQRTNAAIACAAVKASGFSISEASMREGLQRVWWPGRFQRDANMWLDGAHNPQGIESLVKTWRATYPDIRPKVIFGVLEDKGAAEMVAALAEIAEEIWFVPIQSDRATTPQQLTGYAPGACQVWNTLAEALRTARGSSEPFLVTGSLYLIGEAMDCLEIQPFDDAVSQ